MGKTLHNKIHLGRSPLLGSWRWHLGLGCGVIAGLALAAAALRGWHI
jgi:hypothetical protein